MGRDRVRSRDRDIAAPGNVARAALGLCRPVSASDLDSQRVQATRKQGRASGAAAFAKGRCGAPSADQVTRWAGLGDEAGRHRLRLERDT